MPDLTPETLAELRRRHAALTPFALSFLTGGPGGDPYIALAAEDGSQLTDAGFDAVLLFAEMASDSLPALLDAAAERDALAAAVERVRVLHGPRVVQVLGATCSAEECDHEDACPLVDYTVCGHCYDVGDGAHPYAYEDGGLQDVAHPCATYRALDATPETGGEL